ncbi:MAG: DUF433 domain-containing protein [Ginsengibacter sp.]
MSKLILYANPTFFVYCLVEYPIYKNIISNPDICNGKPVIKGTRITVKSVMNFIIAGDTDKKILKNYPHLTEDDLQACKEFDAVFFEKPFVIKTIKA